MTKKTLQMGAGASQPSGAVFHKSRPIRVSDEFIASLAKDGVSEGTIKSIERDNAHGSQGTTPTTRR